LGLYYGGIGTFKVVSGPGRSHPAH
jgi:hypothetical protein